jgi:hypothetical protein
VTGRGEGRCEQLLDVFRKWKRSALYRTVWRSLFGRFYGLVVKAECGMNMQTVVMDRISYCIASPVTKFATDLQFEHFAASNRRLSRIINTVAQHKTQNERVSAIF